ncbi:MAG: hypothetical protein V4857_04205 [Pseudomonadota bacterium]
MPITPFHFGPGAAIHALAPRHISFIGFVAANVIIDLEPLYFILTDQYPLHRFFHTYIGASVILLAAPAVFIAARRFAQRYWLPDLFGWQQLRAWPVTLGAAAGVYSHIVFDSIMHSDMRPFAPFSDANPLLAIISLGTLELSCVVAGLIGLGILGLRKLGAKAA